jgi:hypothetical protein
MALPKLGGGADFAGGSGQAPECISPSRAPFGLTPSIRWRPILFSMMLILPMAAAISLTQLSGGLRYSSDGECTGGGGLFL